MAFGGELTCEADLRRVEWVCFSVCQDILASVSSSVLSCARCEACLVVACCHPLRQFTDEMADEHVGFLDAWH